MPHWKLTSEHERYGIALHNFQQDADYRIKLNVGEAVHIVAENCDWYFGSTAKQKSIRGIFPKCFIEIRECIVEKSGSMETILPKHSPIIHEITAVVREWGVIWKQFYVSNHPDFDKIRKMIYELMGYRSKILSGTLPIDELKDTQQIVTSKIDYGNNILGLDMVVRDEQGNILNPDLTSTIQLYWQHEKATERIREEGSIQKQAKIVTQHSHILFVSVRNFVCKLNEDSELLMTLYDAKEGRSITENYVVRWSREGLAQDLDQLHNLKVLFTDLGSRDLRREKVYFVCYVIRIGAMEAKEIDVKRSSQMPRKYNLVYEVMRRPCGVAAMDVTLFLSGKLECDEDKQHFIPFVQCWDKENLDSSLKKILNLKEIPQKDHKGQGLWASMKVLHGDLKQVREENPHLVLGSVAIARKMGFPEVILPGDVRNDLYLTLIGGEFSKGNKSTDKNMEVTVRVCNEKGSAIPGVIYLGGGVQPINEYHSVIYYHEDKPKWYETFKIAVPIEEFKTCHLKFTFKHRSSNESKDKSEKPFAMSYVKLMQKDDTTLPNTNHDILVYKIDHKKYDESDINYLRLPSTRSELSERHKSDGQKIDGQKSSDNSKIHVNGLSLSNKDILQIATNVCSTKLTQNVDLLRLLNWSANPEGPENSLESLMHVDGDEVVKFLQDVLDALFGILMQNCDSDIYDNKVFDCLLFIIGLVSDKKYEHFQPVLDMYIKESFSATLAYNKLIIVLKHHIDTAQDEGAERDILLKSLKSLPYILRFIVRSRVLFSVLPGDTDQERFEENLKDLLNSIVKMMCLTGTDVLPSQAACLKYLPAAVPDLLLVYDGVELSTIMANILCKLSKKRIVQKKMSLVKEIVHCELFKKSECRAVLLPVILTLIRDLLANKEEDRLGVELRNKSNAKIAKILGAKSGLDDSKINSKDEMKLIVEILSDVMDLLFRAEAGQTIEDVTLIMKSVLRTVIQSTILHKDIPLQGNIVAVMIAIFRQMTRHHFEQYIEHFPTKTDLLDFLMEILLVFKDLVRGPVYPNDWCDMIMLQNTVILKCLGYFASTIMDYFKHEFEYQPWNNFFHCAIAFITQPALQLETFSSTKRARIVSKYKDMRKICSIDTIKKMWFNLGQHKIRFIPNLVGSILEMTLLPEPELRRSTIPIFFDMMQCEFYLKKYDNMDNIRDSTNIKSNFNDFENEMIAKLDTLVEGGRGDGQYQELLKAILMDYCENHNTMREQGMKFVDTITRLMERLLEYRNVMNDENKENRMSCTVNLLDFYSEINRKEMYIRYVYKLCELHLECDNFTEAAYTLKLHSKLLLWSDTTLPPLLRSARYPEYNTHRELKEKIYYDMIEYYDKGKMWERAIKVCKELVKQYEEEIYDYEQLSVLLKKMSQFYDNIMRQGRPEPEYFRVAFYGRGFPSFLQNKVFVYRGKEYERLGEFVDRTCNHFPNAELLKKLTPPGAEITESRNQYLQINSVEPVMDERRSRMAGKAISEQVFKYYRVNDVQKFRYSRPFHQEPRDRNNEFASLWVARTVLVISYPLPGILRWFPVTATDTTHLTPLQNAIETMENTNKKLKELIVSHAKDYTLSLNQLTMTLNGIVDAAVMGGVSNYEKAFFTPEYLESHKDDGRNIALLQDHIAEQIPLLEVGLRLHNQKISQDMIALQQKMDTCFAELKIQIEQKYGKRSLDAKLEPLVAVTMRRQTSTTSSGDTQRLSEVSLASEANRSRISSLTRSQVANFKSLAAINFSQSFSSLNNSNTNTIGRNNKTSPVTRAQTIFVRSPSNSSTLSKSNKREKKEKVRNSGRKLTISTPPTAISPATPISNSQWYTSETDISPLIPLTTVTPVFELRQELTPKRPLRSEAERERRLSRPSSGQFQPKLSPHTTRLNGTSSNRDSIATTDSTASEDDPPPLPQKLREADYSNLPEETESIAKSFFSAINPLRARNKPVPAPPPEQLDDDDPPTPPPKRPQFKPPDID